MPMSQHASRYGAARAAMMLCDQMPQKALVIFLIHVFESDHVAVAQTVELLSLVEHERGSTAHTGREIPPGWSQHHDGAAGHVFAAVIAHALHPRAGATITNGEALSGDSTEVRLPTGRAVE